MTMSLPAHFHRMDVTRPHLWWISCELCQGTGVAQLPWNRAAWCTECDRSGKIRIVAYRPDSLKVAQRRLGIVTCVAAAALACYLIF